MKKIIAILLFLIFIIPTGVIFVHADEEPTEPTTSQSYFDADGFREIVIGDETEVANGGDIEGAMKWYGDLTSISFDMVQYFFQGADVISQSLINGNVVKALTRVFLPLSWIILIISWVTGMAKKSLTLELYEAKGMLASFAGLIVGMILITVAEPILLLILKMASGISNDLLGSTQIQFQITLNSAERFSSKIPIIGPIITIIQNMVGMVPYMLMMLVLSIAVLVICVKLGIRAVKLAMYQGIAPVFFGLSASDATRRYFVNFILQFIVTAFQIVFISIFFSIFKMVYANYITQTTMQVIDPFSVGIVVVALVVSIMICKSDKYLSDILHT